MNPKSEEKSVNLYEDNVGNLYIGADDGPWFRVAFHEDHFRFDAANYILGDEAAIDWLDMLEDVPIADLVATYTDTGAEGASAIVRIHGNSLAGSRAAGRNAMEYMGLKCGD